jgi:hypothetical protein
MGFVAPVNGRVPRDASPPRIQAARSSIAAGGLCLLHGGTSGTLITKGRATLWAQRLRHETAMQAHVLAATDAHLQLQAFQPT